MERRRSKKLVKKAIERKAIRILKAKGYRSACRGLCGRRMRKVARKVRTQRKRYQRQVRGLKKFKRVIVKKQIRKLRLPTRKISKKQFKAKVTQLNAKLAEGLITRSEWTTYTTQLRRWVVISRRTYRVRVRRLRVALKRKSVSKKVYRVKIRALRRRKHTSTRCTWKRFKIKVRKWKTQVKMQKISTIKYRRLVKKVEAKVVIPARVAETRVTKLKVQLEQGKIT